MTARQDSYEHAPGCPRGYRPSHPGKVDRCTCGAVDAANAPAPASRPVPPEGRLIGSELRVEPTYNKRRRDGWTFDVVDQLGVVCKVIAADRDDEDARAVADHIANALAARSDAPTPEKGSMRFSFGDDGACEVEYGTTPAPTPEAECERCDGSGCDLTMCEDCGEEFTDPCERHRSFGHVPAAGGGYDDGTDCSSCCTACHPAPTPEGPDYAERVLEALDSTGLGIGKTLHRVEPSAPTPEADDVRSLPEWAALVQWQRDRQADHPTRWSQHDDRLPSVLARLVEGFLTRLAPDAVGDHRLWGDRMSALVAAAATRPAPIPATEGREACTHTHASVIGQTYRCTYCAEVWTTGPSPSAGTVQPGAAS